MKIEMGESLLLSWAKHVKHCQIVTLNWKCSKGWLFYNQKEVCDLIKKINTRFSEEIFGKSTTDQIISQAETDVLGLNIDNNIVKNIYAIEVAFHEDGLHYNKDKKTNNLNKITEKFLRSALVLFSVFNVKTGNIVFASPKVRTKDEKELIERTKEIELFMKSLGFDYRFSFICNQNFYDEIFVPVQRAATEEADTGELFMRCLQMISLFKKSATNAPYKKIVDDTKLCAPRKTCINHGNISTNLNKEYFLHGRECSNKEFERHLRDTSTCTVFVTLFYENKPASQHVWQVNNFTQTSNLSGNLHAGFLRNWQSKQIIGIKLEIK